MPSSVRRSPIGPNDPGRRPKPAPKPAPKSSRALILGITLGAAGLIVVAIAVAVAFSGGKPAGPDPIVKKPDLVPEKPPEKPPERPPQRPPEKPPEHDPERDFKERQAEARKDAQRRLDEARAEIADLKKAADDAAAALRTRIGGKPLAMILRSGVAHEKSLLRASDLADVEFESNGKTIRLPWDAVSAASILAAADILYDANNADKQVERGRFLLARKLWKEAKEAFARALKLDEGLESRLEEVRSLLDRIVSGRGFFHGAARRVGPSGLAIAYDFTDKAQLDDWTQDSFTHAPGLAILEGKEFNLSYLPLALKEEAEIEATVACAATFCVLLIGRGEWYEASFGPDGAAIHALDPTKARELKRQKELARSEKGKLDAKPHDVRVTIRGRKMKLTVDRVEAASADLPTGRDAALDFRLGVAVRAGKASISMLKVSGLVDGRELDKQFAEVEVLVRRAIDPELRDIQDLRSEERARMMLGTTAAMLTADDVHLTAERMPGDMIKYDELKRQWTEHLVRGYFPKKLVTELDEMITRCPTAPALYYLRALKLQQEEDDRAAIADLGKAIELYPNFVEALALLARLLDTDHDYDAAAELATKAIEAMPDYAPAYVARAKANYARDPDTFERCMADLRIALCLQPQNSEAPIYLRMFKYASRGPKDMGCSFEVESEHYLVTSDISLEASKLYAERLEAAFRHYRETFKTIYVDRKFRKPRITVFNVAESYHTYRELSSSSRGESAVGSFHQRTLELVLFEDLDLEETLSTLYHEAFHHFMSLMVRHELPFWYNEGLAEYMSAMTIQDGKVVETAKILPRVSDLDLMVQIGLTMKFEAIMLETPRQFYSGLASLKYAQAWSMVHFFYQYERGKYRSLIEKYLDLLRAKKSPKEAYEAVFKGDAKALEVEWKKFAGTLKKKP